MRLNSNPLSNAMYGDVDDSTAQSNSSPSFHAMYGDIEGTPAGGVFQT
jgi:hypothetical protein